MVADLLRDSCDGTRARGTIERRGNSLRIKVYAGVDPLTGKRLYLRESTTDEAEAERILTRLLNEVDEQRNGKTQATLQRTFEEWLQIHEVDESPRELYEGFLAHHIGPLIGDEPVARITPRTLEQFYAELRRCRAHCDGQPGRVDHRTTYPHGVPRREAQADCPAAGRRAVRRTTTSRPDAKSRSARRMSADRCRRRRARRSISRCAARWARLSGGSGSRASRGAGGGASAGCRVLREVTQPWVRSAPNGVGRRAWIRRFWLIVGMCGASV
ncbi:hypothetical protein FHS23_003029 [Prauserella isguenensis]|uniref:Core-binding (CB) domain-containing protein n=1 Tax=Prauserella isguenensis TaxID=1470180 RepID=A0A839S4Q3_9PSEU|nr:hypothetical protein [Prauserella isguenensis]